MTAKTGRMVLISRDSKHRVRISLQYPQTFVGSFKCLADHRIGEGLSYSSLVPCLKTMAVWWSMALGGLGAFCTIMPFGSDSELAA